MTARFDLALLVGAAILLVAVGAVRFSTRLGLPTLLVYLGLGVAIGASGLGVHPDNLTVVRGLSVGALLLIIAEGGLSTRWPLVRPVIAPSTLLATVGIAISVGVVGVAAHYLAGLSWRTALLAGAVLSPTDAAAIFATLRRLRLPPRLAATLEAESGINDAPALLAVALLTFGPPVAASGWLIGLLLVYELAAGAALGVLVGLAGAWALRRAALPAAGLYPLATVGLTVLAYAVGAVAHASGIIAVYACGLVLGNARLPHRHAILGFADGVAWLAQIGLFILLGLLATPGRLGEAVPAALAIGAVLVLVARPASVVASVTAFRVPWREQAFLSWAGLRGAVPIVLATIPLSEALPEAGRLFNVVFVLVVVFTLVQGTTLAATARLLRVTAPAEVAELEVETAPLEEMRADLLQLEIPQGSRLAGVYLNELRLPTGAAVTLVLRDGTGFVPASDTRLRIGDNILIVSTTEARDAAERRLRAVSRRGRLARWFHEEGEDRPS